MCGSLRTLESDTKISALPNLAYSLSKRLNQDLPYSLSFTASDLDEFQRQTMGQTAKTNNIKRRSTRKPLVLCFGGQVSDRIGLDKQFWQECATLRFYLDVCNSSITRLGYPSIYPAIFEKNSIPDVVTLHAATFAIQYATAQAWLESGIHVDSIVGHSFGQLTALCVSGMLSLDDGVRLVLGRAALMKKHWGEEPGTMILVQADQKTVESFWANGHDFEIACFNGPSSHVIVSDRASSERITKELKARAIKQKRLDVPYGFHSRFTEPLLSHLGELASELVFHQAKIPIESCTDVESWSEPSPARIIAHTREPVYFLQALRRLQKRFGDCTWVEAGTGSGIVNMVKAAFGSHESGHIFLPLTLDKPNSGAVLADASVSLWSAGHNVKFWLFCRDSHHQYDRLRLPPYAWDKSRHWLPLNLSGGLGTTAPPTTTSSANAQSEDRSIALLQLKSASSGRYEFSVNSGTEQYLELVKGIKASGKDTVPAAVFVELAFRAIAIVHGTSVHGQLSLHNIQTQITGGVTHVEVHKADSHWAFKFLAGKDCCSEGVIYQQQERSTLHNEFNRYERLLSHGDLVSILDDPQSQCVRGNLMYKLLSRVTTYPPWYRGVASVATKGSTTAARIVRPSPTPPTAVMKERQTETEILEGILQVAYFHANCFQEADEGTFPYEYTRWRGVLTPSSPTVSPLFQLS